MERDMCVYCHSQRRVRGLTLGGGSGNEEKWTPEIYLELGLAGGGDGWNIESEGGEKLKTTPV